MLWIEERKFSTTFTHLNIETAFDNSYRLQAITWQFRWIEITQIKKPPCKYITSLRLMLCNQKRSEEKPAREGMRL